MKKENSGGKENLYGKLLGIHLSVMQDNGYTQSSGNIKLVIDSHSKIACAYIYNSPYPYCDSYFNNCKKVSVYDEYLNVIIERVMVTRLLDYDGDMGDMIDLLEFINIRNAIMREYPKWKFVLDNMRYNIKMKFMRIRRKMK